MTDPRAAYVALALTPGVGGATLRKLLEACHTADGVLAAPSAFLGTIPGINRDTVTAIRQATIADGQRVLDAASKAGAAVLIPGSDEFPHILAHIPEPPPLLFALGKLDLLGRTAVALVGSRDHSRYGADVCRRLAAEAASADLVVVSGMARGLDAVAHAAALDSGGATIGVLGNGIGVIYPAANRYLYERVAREGLLLTEYPPGERPHAGSFPRRNRIISGLARVTVVVEAAAGSGALITAGTALDQGREVLAVPGPITSATAIGVNRLLRDGATPYLEPGDLLAAVPGVSGKFATITDPIFGATPRVAPPTVAPELLPLFQALGPDALPIDILAARMEQSVASVLASLSELELAGAVQQLPGWRFRRSG